jgi:hypothetical protein
MARGVAAVDAIASAAQLQRPLIRTRAACASFGFLSFYIFPLAPPTPFPPRGGSVMLEDGGRPMNEEQWLACDNATAMFEFVRRTASERKLRLFACALCETYRREFPDERSRAAVETAYRVADGRASESERAAAYAAARAFVAGSIPAYAVGTRDQFTQVPFLVLARFRHHSDSNPIPAVCFGLRELFGNPFGRVAIDQNWLTSTVVAIAREMYESRDFGAMPILADALQDAGCDSADILDHCRWPEPHARGCWVVDLVLGK